MKRFFCVLVLFAILISLGSCKTSANKEHQKSSAVSFDLPDSVSRVSVEHYVGGRSSGHIVENEELQGLKSWLTGLKCEECTFEPGASPGDANGAELYTFTAIDGDSELSYSFILYGNGKCYCLFDNVWYSVSNPIDPPISFFETMN